MRWYIAVTAGLALSGAAARADSGNLTQPATRPSASSEAMRKRIQLLESRINELESQPAPSAGEKTAVVAAAANRVVLDADRHGLFMSMTDVQSGYDPDIGFVLRSDDGNFMLHPKVMVQFRYAGNDRQSIPGGGGGITGATGTDTQTGAEIHRARISIDGNLFNQNLTYFFQVADDSWTNGMTLLDAYLMYRMSNQSPLALKFGQFKDPLWHEQNVSPGQQMAADRSLANTLVGGGQDYRVQGIALVYDENNLRGQISVHDGFNGQNLRFGDPPAAPSAVSSSSSSSSQILAAGAGVEPTNWGASVRAEYLLIGERTPDFNPYSEYDDFTARGNKTDILVLGAGADYSESGSDKILFHTVDAQYENTNGLSLFGAYLGVYRNLNVDKGVAAGSYYDSAFIAQAAYLVTPNFEPFVRYDYTHLDGRAIPGIMKDNIHEITVGANYYMYGHNLKLTIDGSWLPNGCYTDVPFLGILQDDGHPEFTLRAQLQLMM